MLILLALAIVGNADAVPKIQQVLGARVHEFMTVDKNVVKEDWFKLYLNATSMQFHVRRDFDYEKSEVVVYSGETFYKYYELHEP